MDPEDKGMEQFYPNYFPTTVLLLDDREAFLNGIALNLREDILHTLYHDPIVAIEAVRKDFEQAAAVKKISQLNELLSFPNRFQNISVAFVDYLMPSMNGVDFCREIKDLPMRKVIMTGNVDLAPIHAAIEAGIVDQLILKSEAGFLQKIEAIVDEAQHDFCREFNACYLPQQETALASLIKDPQFVDFFYSLMKERQFVEYYLLNDKGQFLLFDRAGKASQLTILTDAQLKEYYQTLKTHEVEIPEDVLESLRLGKKIPIDLTAEISAETIQKKIVPAESFKGSEQTYYYTITPDVDLSFMQDKPVTYHNYLMQFYV